MAEQVAPEVTEAPSDKPAAKPKRMPPSRKGKGPTPTSWKPGQSGNPAGRPKRLEAFADRVRERVDPDLVIELAMTVAEDTTMPPVQRLAALWPLVDRGWCKPPTNIAATVSAGEPADEVDLSQLSDEQLHELAELDDRRAAILASGAGETEGVRILTSPTTIDAVPTVRPPEGDPTDG